MRTLTLTLTVALAALHSCPSVAAHGPGPTGTIDVRQRASVELGLAGVPLVEPFLVAHPTDPALLVGAAMRVDTPDWKLVVFRSEDGGGSTFERSLIRRGVVPWGFPMLATEPAEDPPSRRLYATWVEPGPEGGLDVMVAHSDEGDAWSEPARVNGGPAGFRGAPFVAVNDAGTVAVAWSDWRHGDEERFCSDVYFAASVDRGATFLPEVRLSVRTSCALTEANARPARRWRMGGDYRGMTMDAEDDFRPIWADARSGMFQLHTAVVRVGSAPDAGSTPSPAAGRSRSR